MSFLYKKNLNGGTQPTAVTEIIDNSDTVTVGDMVFHLNGNLEIAASGTKALFGVVQDIVDANGNSMFGSIATIGGAIVTNPTTPGAGQGTVQVASDNETVDLVAAKVIIDRNAVFSADQDGTVNTTLSSSKGGAYFNLTDETQVDETTATRTLGNQRVLYSFGEDPDDTTRLLVVINAHEVFSNVDVLT